MGPKKWPQIFLSRIFDNGESDILYINLVNKAEFPLEKIPEELKKDPHCLNILEKLRDKEEVTIGDKTFEKIDNLIYLKGKADWEKN